MSLFTYGEFTAHSGGHLDWKIDTDSLVEEDWACLARVICPVLPPFRRVEGIPRGGLAFAAALEKYADTDASAILIADDVMTTGGSFEEHRAGRAIFYGRFGNPGGVLGVVAFARGQGPSWVTPIFSLVPWLRPGLS